MEKIVNNSEDSEFNGDSSQRYDSDMSPENINRYISSNSEEGDYSDDEEE